MFVLNANNQQEDIVTSAEYIESVWEQIYLSNNQTGYNYWIDKTNKYIYIVVSEYYRWPSRLRIVRYSYGNWKLSNETPITLSWFGTFTSTPVYKISQWSHSGNFYIYWDSVGWSWSLTALTVTPVTISGTTATLGTAVTPEGVGGCTLNHIAPYWTTLYAIYQTTSTNVPNVMKKWDWSTWTDVTSTPHSVMNWYAYGADIYKWTIWVWTNNTDRYIGFPTVNMYSGGGYKYSEFMLKFDFTTDTRSKTGIVSAYWFITDVNGFLICNKQMITPDGKIIPFFANVNAWWLPSDIKNWLFPAFIETALSWYTYNIINFAWAAVWANKRIKNAFTYRWTSTPSPVALLLYSIDWGTTFQTRFFSSIDIPQYTLNLFWDIVAIVYTWQAANYLSVEIVS